MVSLLFCCCASWKWGPQIWWKRIGWAGVSICSFLRLFVSFFIATASRSMVTLALLSTSSMGMLKSQNDEPSRTTYQCQGGHDERIILSIGVCLSAIFDCIKNDPNVTVRHWHTKCLVIFVDQYLNFSSPPALRSPLERSNCSLASRMWSKMIGTGSALTSSLNIVLKDKRLSSLIQTHSQYRQLGRQLLFQYSQPTRERQTLQYSVGFRSIPSPRRTSVHSSWHWLTFNFIVPNSSQLMPASTP